MRTNNIPQDVICPLKTAAVHNFPFLPIQTHILFISCRPSFDPFVISLFRTGLSSRCGGTICFENDKSDVTINDSSILTWGCKFVQRHFFVSAPFSLMFHSHHEKSFPFSFIFPFTEHHRTPTAMMNRYASPMPPFFFSSSLRFPFATIFDNRTTDSTTEMFEKSENREKEKAAVSQ
jgi:hypothetical protein